MKTLKRYIIVRSEDGNDVVREYEVTEYESLTEIYQGLGEARALDIINRAGFEVIRNAERMQLAYELKNKK